MNMPKVLTKSCSLVLGLSLFFLVLGSKLWTLKLYGSDVPCWDQWDADVLHVFVPFFNHQLTLHDFFRQHNEHRVVFTKLLNLGLLMVSGQWDPRVQCVVNACLHSSLAVAFFFFARRLLTTRWHAVLFLATAVMFGLPIARQNILGGFHSAQYLLLWFSLIAMTALSLARPWSLWWWVGTLFAIAANFTLGSGFFASVSFASILMARVIFRQIPWKTSLPTFGACGIAVLVGVLSYAPISGNDWMKAHSFREFYLTLAHCLQWPNSGVPWRTQNDLIPWVALVVYMPFIIFAGFSLRRGVRYNEENAAIALGFWVIFQSAATAYARSIGGSWPASRYLDTLAIGVLLNALLLGVLSSRIVQPRLRRTLIGLGVVWLLLVGQGLWQHIRYVLKVDFPENKQELVSYETNVRNYLLTENIAELEGKVIPYINAPELVMRLSFPEIRAILPSSIRPPLKLNFQAVPENSFTFNEGNHFASSAALCEVGSVAGITRGECVSSVFKPQFNGYLSFKALAKNDTHLAFRLNSKDKDDPQLFSRKLSGSDGLQTVYIPTKAKNEQVAISNLNSEGPFTLGPPVEISTLSYAALRMVQSGRAIFFTTLLLTTLFGLLNLFMYLSPARRDNAAGQ